MSSRPLLHLACCIFFVVSTGCSRQTPRAVERVAIVAFDNLTDSQENAWIGRAIAQVAAMRTAGHEKIQTFDVPSVRDAQARFATQTLTGYLTRSDGGLVLHAALRDEAAGSTIRSFSATGSERELAALASAVATETGAPLHTGRRMPQPAAMKALLGFAGDAPQEWAAAIRQALQADPQYGAAHVAWVELNARLGRREESVAGLQQARSADLTPAQQAQVDVLTAELQGDRTARAAAMMRFAALNPGNLQVWRATAEAHLNARAYDGAVRACEAILELVPDDEVALNSRGYALTYSGDFARAREAFEEYRRRRPESANAIDSTGEMMFYFGRFADAEKLFLEAHAKNPAHLNGNQPFRAALSRFMAGDAGGADTLMASFLADARKRKDPLVDARSALWQAMTGRLPRQAPADPLVQTLHSLWMLRAGDRAAAVALADRARSTAKNPAVLGLASMAYLLAQPSADANEWASRIARAVPPQLAQVQGQRLLGWALLLDGKPAEAARVWRAFYDALPMDSLNTERILLTLSLVESGQVGEAKKVMPHGFLPPAALDPGLDLLVYPKAAELRKRLGS